MFKFGCQCTTSTFSTVHHTQDAHSYLGFHASYFFCSAQNSGLAEHLLIEMRPHITRQRKGRFKFGNVVFRELAMSTFKAEVPTKDR